MEKSKNYILCQVDKFEVRNIPDDLYIWVQWKQVLGYEQQEQLLRLLIVIDAPAYQESNFPIPQLFNYSLNSRL